MNEPCKRSHQWPRPAPAGTHFSLGPGTLAGAEGSLQYGTSEVLPIPALGCAECPNSSGLWPSPLICEQFQPVIFMRTAVGIVLRQGNQSLLNGIVVDVRHLLLKHVRTKDLNGAVRLLPEHELLILLRARSRFLEQSHHPLAPAFARLVQHLLQDPFGHEALEVAQYIAQPAFLHPRDHVKVAWHQAKLSKTASAQWQRVHIRPAHNRERAEIADARRVGLQMLAHVDDCTVMAQ